MPQMQQDKEPQRPAQQQTRQPGIEAIMEPLPESKPLQPYRAPKLLDKVALITGGDSGIGRAVALAFAEEGADVMIVYLDEDEDAQETVKQVESRGRKARAMAFDVSDESACKMAIQHTIELFGRLDILVNNAARQDPQESIEDISEEQLEMTFRVNIFSQFFMTKAALPHLKKGAAIINTTSVTAYRGSPSLLDYSATKGAIVSFTRSLAHSLVKRGIRVNGVAPGPIWTPLIPATFDADKVKSFGSDVPLGRAGEPNEVAPSYVFLASEDSSYMTGQILHPNGGEVVNG